VLAEALDDVVIAPAPLSRAAAHKMISSLRGARVLDGWRGAAPADKEALVETICALAAFAAANDAELESIEVNPFRVLPKGGAALDILIQLRSSA
jgi:hypothetical protein